MRVRLAANEFCPTSIPTTSESSCFSPLGSSMMSFPASSPADSGAASSLNSSDFLSAFASDLESSSERSSFAPVSYTHLDVYKRQLTSYTVSYNANGGSGAPSSQTKWHGKTLTLSSTKPTRTGYTFQGWATSSGGSVAYAAGASYTGNTTITLYAVWKANTYTVKFDANGGSGAPSNQTKIYGQTLTLSSTKPTRANYNFKGWGTSATTTTVAYAAGASYTGNAAITLYAVWELAYTPPKISVSYVKRCSYNGTCLLYTSRCV